MANFFSDNADLRLQFETLDLREPVALLERGFGGTWEGDDSAPDSYDDALEIYAASLDLLGEICANFIAPLSLEIDAAGTRHDNGEVHYSPQTKAAYAKLAESGFTGVMLPRRYGGSGFPVSVYVMMIEMVSQADASLMTLFGYQDVGELIARFGSADQAERYLPGLASGDFIGSIVLSEPGAGSDLQAIKLKASENADGTWHLTGTKHFISNGCGDVLMVLARSEEKISNIFGLSLFVCPKSANVKVAKVEKKMGLHGSPTCELVFDQAPAELVGKRKAGLTRYVLENLTQARFSVAAQALGIAHGAFLAAEEYAGERTQFGRKIGEFPAVAELLEKMQIALQSGRAMLYESTRWLDLKVQLAEAIEHGRVPEEEIPAARQTLKQASRYINLLSPLVKYVVTEASQTVCIDAQQVFGGLGYMWETGMEKRVRDVRITTIYEGASQVQISSSLKHILSDALGDMYDNWAASRPANDPLGDVATQIAENRAIFEKVRSFVQAQESAGLADAAARDLADIYSQIFGAYTLLQHAANNTERARLARRYVVDACAFAISVHEGLRRGRYARWSN